MRTGGEGWDKLIADLKAHALFAEEVRDALSVLTERQREYIEARYGLKDGTFKTFRAVARELGVNKSAPSAAVSTALWRMRTRLGTNELSQR